MAAKKANQDKSTAKPEARNYLLCAQPAATPVVLPLGLAPGREFAIRIGAKKWVNATVLHYAFVNRTVTPRWRWIEAQKAVVRRAFGAWKALGIGLTFVEVADPGEAEIRIGCLQGDGSWSYVGTDNLNNEDLGRTMNFGWDLTTAWGKATALHEIGHALGLSHEHQNPKAGIVWNEQMVNDTFSAPPNNWDAQTIFNNILRKLSPTETEGSNWDPDSIMEYPFEPGLIVSPKPYDTRGIGENTQLSRADIEWVKRWYPGAPSATEIKVMQLAPVEAVTGKQTDFMFKPTATRKYKVQTVGESDCRVVIFEVRDGQPRHLVAEDDSGLDHNLMIRTKLVKGRTYLIRVRVNFAATSNELGLLVS